MHDMVLVLLGPLHQQHKEAPARTDLAPVVTSRTRGNQVVRLALVRCDSSLSFANWVLGVWLQDSAQRLSVALHGLKIQQQPAPVQRPHLPPAVALADLQEQEFVLLGCLLCLLVHQLVPSCQGKLSPHTLNNVVGLGTHACVAGGWYVGLLQVPQREEGLFKNTHALFQKSCGRLFAATLTHIRHAAAPSTGWATCVGLFCARVDMFANVLGVKGNSRGCRQGEGAGEWHVCRLHMQHTECAWGWLGGSCCPKQ